MKTISHSKKPASAARRRALVMLSLFGLALLLAPVAAYAQASPWETAVERLETAITGPIARGLSLIAIVIAGLIFAYGEGKGKTILAGVVFGLGMALGAVSFARWLFPTMPS